MTSPRHGHAVCYRPRGSEAGALSCPPVCGAVGTLTTMYGHLLPTHPPTRLRQRVCDCLRAYAIRPYECGVAIGSATPTAVGTVGAVRCGRARCGVAAPVEAGRRVPRPGTAVPE